MQWHLVIYKVFVSAIIFMSGCSGSALALDKSRLWLSQSDQKYYLDLVRAARVADALDRCQSVLEGTLDREQSQQNHPYFRILCRQENGRSYNEIVDGLSFETLTTPVIVEPELSEAEKEHLRQLQKAQEELELARRKTEAWQRCEEQIRHQTQLMIHMVWLTTEEPAPLSFDDNEAVFIADFDAHDPGGNLLHFSATCTISFPDKVTVSVSRR